MADQDSCAHLNFRYRPSEGHTCKNCDKPLTEDELPHREGFPYIASSAAPTRSRSARAIEINQTEKQWDKDIPAYKRLRKQGLQPAHIDGAADMEARASTRFEVESGKIYEGKEKQIAEATDFINASGGMDVFTPVTTPKESAVE